MRDAIFGSRGVAGGLDARQGFTAVGEISRLALPLGLRTTFYDGLYLASEEQLKRVEGRRIIILLTDGWNRDWQSVSTGTCMLLVAGGDYEVVVSEGYMSR